ncbi:DUF1648 domain-containing protein [Flavobacterium sp.]|uniref:DUF1648 domain-containing protein n=1 Tax=Flavobacterium sp. TaxID=239 RepID=UPI0040336F13
MEERPVIKIHATLTDKILEAMAIVLVAVLWTMLVFGYANLPETIPIHFNGVGDPDGYGDKNTLFLLPVIGTLLYFMLTVLSTRPHIFNYPVAITPENAEKQYRISVRMMRAIKLSVLVVFCTIEYGSYRVALGKQEGLGSYFIIFVLAVIFIPMLYFISKAFGNK